MSEALRAFQEHRQFFLDLVVPVCQDSEEYRHLDPNRLGDVLLLADRAVAACDQQQDNARAIEAATKLSEAFDTRNAEPLLGAIELWLRDANLMNL
jgi:hypothetical protein